MGIPFLETSAKSSSNVGDAFMTMAAEIKNRCGVCAMFTFFCLCMCVRMFGVCAHVFGTSGVCACV